IALGGQHRPAIGPEEAGLDPPIPFVTLIAGSGIGTDQERRTAFRVEVGFLDRVSPHVVAELPGRVAVPVPGRLAVGAADGLLEPSPRRVEALHDRDKPVASHGGLAVGPGVGAHRHVAALVVALREAGVAVAVANRLALLVEVALFDQPAAL